MKDVIFILADSLTRSEEIDAFTMPYLSSKCEFGENYSVYSQGPYTEAGVRSLLTGKSVLDNGGYVKFIDDSRENIFTLFRDLGYFTIAYPWTNGIYGEILNTVDEYKYLQPVSYEYLWSMRLEYFSNLFKNNEFNDYEIVEDILANMFKSFSIFYSKRNSSSYDLIKKNIDYNELDKFYTKISNIRVKFYDTRREIIDEILLEKHQYLFECKYFLKKNILTPEFLNVFSNKKNELQKIRQNQLLHNVLNYKLSFREFFYNLIHLEFDKAKTHLYYYKKYLFDKTSILPDVAKGYIKTDPSCNKIFNDFLEVNIPDTKNIFAFFHLSDTHVSPSFYSYDSSDSEKIEKEYNYAFEKAKDFKKIRKGMDYGYHLSKAYLDNEIENLIKKYEVKFPERINNTLFIVTSDHGYPYIKNYSKGTISIDFDLTGFNSAFYCFEFNTQCLPISITTNNYIIDFIVQLLRVDDNEILKKYRNIVTEETNIALLEYSGSGCPDLYRKEVWLCAFNQFYLVIYIGKLVNQFEISKCVYYDLLNDRNQINPKLVKSNDLYLAEHTKLLKNRFLELKNQLSISKMG
ncbi:MAG: hypothetical protein RR500_01625 [Bacilli bacterium]